MNSGANLAHIEDDADGYIVSQKVRGTVAKEILSAVKKQEGYIWNESGKFAYKSFTRTVAHAKGRKTKENVVCFWSYAYAAREAHKRDDLMPAIEDMSLHPGKYDASNDYGRKRYVKETLVTPEGEVVKKRLSFDEERYAADASLDGYYCILIPNRFKLGLKRL